MIMRQSLYSWENNMHIDKELVFAFLVTIVVATLYLLVEIT